MATKRRLANKRAYDEMLVLHQLLIEDEFNEFKIFIEVDKYGKETYNIEHIVFGEVKKTLIGDNYVEISKKVIEYLNDLR